MKILNINKILLLFANFEKKNLICSKYLINTNQSTLLYKNKYFKINS